MGFLTLVFLLVLAPLIWVALAIWCVVRQVTTSGLGLWRFASVVAVQVAVVSLPFIIGEIYLRQAGLSDFTVCPNGQEYCDDFYRLERLRGRILFYHVFAAWVGVAIWTLALLASFRQKKESV